MEETMNIAGDAIIASAEFMSDYGGVIAVACYASGNIGLGMVIDGVSLTCDISLTASQYVNKEISAKKALFEVANTLAATAIGSSCGSDFEKAAKRVLMDPKTRKIFTNCISDFVSQDFSALVEIQTEN